MIEVTDEMVHAAALAFTNKATEAVYVIVRRMLKAALETHEANKPKPEPVGYVKTIGGYPDESEHKVEWVVKYKELKDGQPLYTTQPTREPLSDDALDNMLWKADSDKLDGVTMRQFRAAARLIEKAHGIGVTNDQPQTVPTR